MPESHTGLIADIGATNARFALSGGDGFHGEMVLQCSDYEGIEHAVRAYLDAIAPDVPPRRAAIAIAGPVTGDWFEMTNHPWAFSIERTGQALGFDSFTVLNDFKAVALAVPRIPKDHIVPVTPGVEPVPGAPIGVIGPGTGLGVASLVHDGQGYIAVPGEGGHVTMPARTAREFQIIQRLLARGYSHVSAERVCSGKGLVNLYNAICDLDALADAPRRSAEEISRAAIEGSCAASAEALDHMMAFLGRVAGNLALTLGTQGGIYIAGGIPSKLGDTILTSRFNEEFCAKGRYKGYLGAIPRYMITDPYIAFRGLQSLL